MVFICASCVYVAIMGVLSKKLPAPAPPPTKEKVEYLLFAQGYKELKILHSKYTKTAGYVKHCKVENFFTLNLLWCMTNETFFD